MAHGPSERQQDGHPPGEPWKTLSKADTVVVLIYLLLYQSNNCPDADAVN